MYDIFYIGSKSDQQWQNFKENFPTIKCMDTVEQATTKSLTECFWIVYPDTEISENFLFDFVPDEWSKDVAHVFLNGESYDGIALLPKNHNYSVKETRSFGLRDRGKPSLSKNSFMSLSSSFKAKL